MIKLMYLAERVFESMVAGVNKTAKYSYTLEVEYEDCKLLIRPFILSEIIMVSGLWEPYVKWILDRDVQNTDVIIDIGANIGVYTIPLARKVSKVIAFEPHPQTSEILEKSIKLNHIRNIYLFQKAVGDSHTKLSYKLSYIPMYSKILTKNEGYSQNDPIVQVEMVDLDTFLSNENHVDWIIIDIEGTEFNVINGARKTIQKHAPKIIIEIHDDKVKKILEEEGYSLTPIAYAYYYAHKIPLK